MCHYLCYSKMTIIGTTKKDNQRKDPRTASSVQPTKKKSTKGKPVTKLATAAKDADKMAHDEELEKKKKKREESKQKREDGERKRKAQLIQARENVQYFSGIPTLPSSFSPPKSPLYSNSSPKQLLVPLLSQPDSPEIQHLPSIQENSQLSLHPKMTKLSYHSSPKTPWHDFDVQISSDECSDVDDLMEQDHIAVRKSCSKCLTLEAKVAVLKKKLKKAKTQLQERECGVYIQIVVNETLMDIVKHM